MDLATEAVETNGNALKNQQKYEESYVGKLQKITNLHEEFWLQLLNNDFTKKVLDFWTDFLELLNKIPPALTAVGSIALLPIFGQLKTLGTQINQLWVCKKIKVAENHIVF